MAASKDHLNQILGGSGLDDTPSGPGEMQKALANPEQEQQPAPHNPGLNDQAPRPDQQPDYQPAPAPEQPPVQAPPPTPDQEAVPPGRLREEAEKRRAAEERANRITDRFEMLNTQIAERQRLEEERLRAQREPTIEDDLQGYVQSKAERLEEALKRQDKEFKEFKEETKREREEASVISEIRQRANSDSQAFGQRNPDFAQAYHWLRNQQVAEIQALTGVSAEEAVAHIDSQELQYTAHRIQKGLNAAEGFYAQARARGWQTPQQQAQPQQAQPQPQPQPTPQALPQPQANPSVYNQPLQQVDHGRQQNMSLDQVPGGGSAVPMDLDRFADMPEADFIQYADQVAAMMARTMR